MATHILLDSLEIKQFRAFEHLRISKLGRVNLIVGKNNVGKTSLLEALWLYAYQGAPNILWKILEGRDEGRGPVPIEPVKSEDVASIIKLLVHGRKNITRGITPIEIGPINSVDKTLSLTLSWFTSQRNEEGIRRLVSLPPDQYELVTDAILGFEMKQGRKQSIYRIDTRAARPQDSENNTCIFVAASGLSQTEVGRYWDGISLTSLEDEVLESLRIIAPEVERVSLVGSRSLGPRSDRLPIVKIDSADDPVPLRSLGEGMNRLFGVALALVNSRNGLFLIDEIESGLHYSVQHKVWELVFEVARRLNIQVFATTHSWDCITAFQEAAKEDEQDEGVLIRLVEKKGRIIADLFDEGDLSVVSREGIEVR